MSKKKADQTVQEEEIIQKTIGKEEKGDIVDSNAGEHVESPVIEEASIDEQQLRIEELEKEIASLKDINLRKVAELENTRKRVQRERVQLFEDAKIGALEEFLPISDDLVRTLSASEGLDIEKSFLQGVQLVAQKFEEVLNKHGVERIDEINVPFDVNLHDAMLRQPASDKKTGSDIVLQVLESGYRIGNKTVRHAKVIVSE